jgi:hypothetical protein
LAIKGWLGGARKSDTFDGKPHTTAVKEKVEELVAVKEKVKES